MDQIYCPYCMSLIPSGSSCPVCGKDPHTYQSSPHHLPPGTILAGRFLVGRVLGEGGFGITYIGRDLRLDLRVAIKEYFPSHQVTRDGSLSTAVQRYGGTAGQGFEQGRERFLKEARAMARMDKTPEIVAVRDFFEENNTAYIVMEYINGTTFNNLVAQYGGRLPAQEFLNLIRPLFGALDTLHGQGLIHRDISPDNLMLENGRVRLLDFGCARESLGGSATMTVFMKQGFSPIEQYRNKGQGPWTDVYALAATIYYCITGRIPPQPMDRLIDEDLIPPRQLGVAITEQQEKALLYAMGLHQAQRFRTVREFYACLYEGAPIPNPQDPAQSQGPQGSNVSSSMGPTTGPFGLPFTPQYVQQPVQEIHPQEQPVQPSAQEVHAENQPVPDDNTGVLPGMDVSTPEPDTSSKPEEPTVESVSYLQYDSVASDPFTTEEHSYDAFLATTADKEEDDLSDIIPHRDYKKIVIGVIIALWVIAGVFVLFQWF